jgi:hypothetical protein
LALLVRKLRSLSSTPDPDEAETVRAMILAARREFAARRVQFASGWFEWVLSREKFAANCARFELSRLV